MSKFDNLSPIDTRTVLWVPIGQAGTSESDAISIDFARGYMFSIGLNPSAGGPSANVTISFTESDTEAGVFTPVPPENVYGESSFQVDVGTTYLDNIGFNGKKKWVKISVVVDTNITTFIVSTLVGAAPPKAPRLKIVGT